MRRPHMNSKPPAPDLSKTYWKPSFPDGMTSAVKREHPILRWGDYIESTGLYVWQNERFKGNNPAYVTQSKRALEGIWYGIENNPRCNRCEKSDRSCTKVVDDTLAITTCARCRLGPKAGCCFANGGKRTSRATVTTKGPSRDKVNEDAEGSNHQPPAIHHRSSAIHGRSGAATERPDNQPPAKRHKSSNSESRPIIQEDSDDEMPIKRFLNRRRTHAGPATKLRSGNVHLQDTTKAAGTHEKNRRRTVIEIPDSPPLSPLFCTPEPTELDQARSIKADVQLSDYSKGTGAIQERLRALEAENQSEKRQNQERVRKLEEQISSLREQQDHKLKEEVRELRKKMNYAINELMMQQSKKAEVGS